MGSFEFPGDYYEIIRADFRDIEAETSFLESYLAGPGRVLDLGCGTGTNLRRLSALGHRCVGVDQSSAFLDYARSFGDDIDYRLTRAAQADLEGSFDLIACMFVTLNYMRFEEIYEVFRRVSEWLSPGGIFVLDIAHLLNFVEDYRPYIIAQHEQGDIFITRFTRHSIIPHSAVWRHDETVLVRHGADVKMYRNVFDQLVLTVPETTRAMARAGLVVKETFGSFRKDPAPARGRGHLILVASAAEPDAS